MKRFLFTLFLSTIIVLLSVVNVQAHESFHWMQQIKKDRMLVVFYNQEEFQANIEQSFQVRLVELSNGKSIPFKYADVSFETNGKRAYSFKKNADENNDVAFSYAFPKKGKYVMTVKLFDNSKLVTEAKFPILVGSGINADWPIILKNYWAEFALVGGLLIFVSYLAGRKNILAHTKKFLKRKNSQSS